MTRRAALSLTVLLVLAAMRPAAWQEPQKPAPKAAEVAGKWTMSLEMSMGTASPALEIKQDGAKITGTYTGRYGATPIQGTISDHAIAFSCTIDAEGQSARMDFRGDIAADGQTMKGTAEIEGLGDATWSARRASGLTPRRARPAVE